MAQKGTGVARDYRATAYCSWLGAVLFIASAACFMAGGFTQRNEMKAAIDGGGSRHERMSKYKELNTTTLQVMWAARRKSEGAYLAAEATGAMAWFSLMPSVDALSTMSGERSASKLLRSCFAAVAVITVADFTFQAGMVQMTDWMSTWTSISEPEPDGGFGAIQALEIAYLVSTSRTVWLFAMDELLLSLGWCTAAFLVYTGTSRTHKPFSKCWAHFSVFCALISFIGVILNIMRVVNFRQFMIPASVVIGLLYLILMPIWGIALGVQLKNRSDPAGMYQSDVSASVDVEIGNTGEAGPRA